MCILIITRKRFYFDAIATWLASGLPDSNIIWQVDINQISKTVPKHQVALLIFGEDIDEQLVTSFAEANLSEFSETMLVISVKNETDSAFRRVSNCTFFFAVNPDDAKEAFSDFGRFLSDREVALVLPTLTATVPNSFSGKVEKSTPALTRSERRVARLILEGLSSNVIAERLCNSEETIKNHRKKIREKLNIKGGKNTLVTVLKNCIDELSLGEFSGGEFKECSSPNSGP